MKRLRIFFVIILSFFMGNKGVSQGPDPYPTPSKDLIKWTVTRTFRPYNLQYLKEDDHITFYFWCRPGDEPPHFIDVSVSRKQTVYIMNPHNDTPGWLTYTVHKNPQLRSPFRPPTPASLSAITKDTFDSDFIKTPGEK